MNGMVQVIDDATFTGASIILSQFLQSTYTAVGYCGSGSRTNGYFNTTISGGGTRKTEYWILTEHQDF